MASKMPLSVPRSLVDVSIVICLVLISVPLSRTAAIERFEKSCEPEPTAEHVGGRATCPFERRLDYDPRRIPAVVPTVTCHCPNSFCRDGGDFRCVEVRESLRVFYVNETSPSLSMSTIHVTTSCVCAISQSTPAEPEITRPT
ncbi:hypothetical protein HPB49_019272 [Dermacentor silvarum]|uniref:Uncharacterized protein n=1 Tax=Dermacentor silvarum TaxID=543639 RepID=A0ACB8DQY9_DERSI|nr:hypothetical protein HPB49_019272 [Dermacentor silvarum]